MKDIAAFKLVLRMAEAHANGHQHCREILEAVARCREIVKVMKRQKPFIGGRRITREEALKNLGPIYVWSAEKAALEAKMKAKPKI